MSSFKDHLVAACGWLELGLPLEAHEELEQIEPEMRTRTEVLIWRVAIYKKLERWGLMEAVTKQLCLRQPQEVCWPVQCAYATRREFSLERACGVLMNAVQRFPKEPTIHYNLACYEAQLGHLDAARQRLAEAVRLAPTFAKTALEDADLTALHVEIREDARRSEKS